MGILILMLVGLVMIGLLAKATSWEIALPVNPTIGQQMRAMAFEFFGKCLLLGGLAFGAFIVVMALSHG